MNPEQIQQLNQAITGLNTESSKLEQQRGVDLQQISTLPIPQTTTTSTQPTMGDLFEPITPQSSEADRIQEDLYRQSQGLVTDQETIRQNYISQFQDRINALNQIYDEQLNRARQEGQGRIGSGTAILARRGLAGSPRGGAIQEGILEQNRQVESAIQAQRNAEIQSIYGMASQMAVEEARERARAKQEGAQSYLDYLKGADERKASYLDQNIQALIAGGYDINEIDVDRLASQLGVSRQQILSQYQQVLQAQLSAQADAELKTAKTQAEIDKINADIARGDISTVDLGNRIALLDKKTGEITGYLDKGLTPDQARKTTDLGGGEDGGISDYQAERASRTISSASTLLAKAKSNPEIFGRSAAFPLPDFLRGDAFRDFESNLQTLKSNIAFGELTAMREASKTGGALGQVSDREGRLLESALGSLDMKQSPGEVQTQLQNIIDSINRWQAAVAKEQGVSTNNLKEQVQQAGYDYDAMKEDGLTDDQIRQALGN